MSDALAGDDTWEDVDAMYDVAVVDDYDGPSDLHPRHHFSFGPAGYGFGYAGRRRWINNLDEIHQFLSGQPLSRPYDRLWWP